MELLDREKDTEKLLDRYGLAGLNIDNILTKLKEDMVEDEENKLSIKLEQYSHENLL